MGNETEAPTTPAAPAAIPDTQAPAAAPPGGPEVDVDDAVAREESAIELARELLGNDRDDEDGDDELADDEAPEEPAAAKPDATDEDDDEDPLAALEEQVRKQQAQQRQQQQARAQAQAEAERSVAAARDEGRAAAATELAQRLRADPLGVLDELGLDARQHYVTLRDHAANPQARPAARAPAPGQPQDFKAAVAAAVAETLRGLGVAVPGQQPPPPRADDGPPESAQHETAKAAFAQLTGDVDRFPLLSDLDPEERARIGVLAATRRLSQGRAGEGDLEEVAQEAEELLQKRVKRQAARLGKVAGAAATGETGGGRVQQGAERAQPAKRNGAPRTLTPDLAASRATPKPNYPDGIEPEEVRIAAAMRIARDDRRARERNRE